MTLIAESLEGELRRAGAKWTVGEFIIASAVSSSIFMLLGQQMGLAIAVGGAVVGAVLPFFVVRKMQARRRRKFEDQLPDAIGRIVNAMRAGFSFQAGVKVVFVSLPEADPVWNLPQI